MLDLASAESTSKWQRIN